MSHSLKAGVLAAALLAAASAVAAPSPPPNDTVLAAARIPDSQKSLFGTLDFATPDPDAVIAGSTSRPSVWYRIDAPKPGAYYIDTAGTFYGRVAMGEIVLSVFSKTGNAGPLLKLKEGGAIKVDGENDGTLSGLRFLVPAGTDRLYIAVSVAGDKARKPFRLNLHRFPAGTTNPVVVTPPIPFTRDIGAVGQPMAFNLQPMYVIHSATSSTQTKAKYRLVDDFAGRVSYEVPTNVVLSDNEALSVRPVAVAGGPHLNAVGTFDHTITAEASHPFITMPFGSKPLKRKLTRVKNETSTGIMEMTTRSSRLGMLGDTVTFDVTLKNLTGLKGIGCIFGYEPPFSAPVMGLVTGQNFSWVEVDPDTGAPKTEVNQTFDISNGLTRHFRLTSQISRQGLHWLSPTVSCAAPLKAKSVGGNRLHHVLLAETSPVVFQYPLPFANADIDFPEASGLDDANPRLLAVPGNGQRTIRVTVTNRYANPRTLTVKISTDPFGWGAAPAAYTASLCADSPGIGTGCVTTPAAAAVLPFAAGESRDVLVTLTAVSGQFVPPDFAHRSWVDVLSGQTRVGIAGFQAYTPGGR